MINEKCLNQRLINNQLSDLIKESNEPNPKNIHSSQLSNDCLGKKFDTKFTRFDKNLEKNLTKNWMNLNEKKMFFNRNLIYESASNLNGTLTNQSNSNHLNGNHLNGNHLNANQINTNQLNHQLNQLNQLNNSQLNGQISHLIQETKQNLHNQIITGNAYSNYPFNVHETVITGMCLF